MTQAFELAQARFAGEASSISLLPFSIDSVGDDDFKMSDHKFEVAGLKFKLEDCDVNRVDSYFSYYARRGSMTFVVSVDIKSYKVTSYEIYVQLTSNNQILMKRTFKLAPSNTSANVPVSELKQRLISAHDAFKEKYQSLIIVPKKFMLGRFMMRRLDNHSNDAGDTFAISFEEDENEQSLITLIINSPTGTIVSLDLAGIHELKPGKDLDVITQPIGAFLKKKRFKSFKEMIDAIHSSAALVEFIDSTVSKPIHPERAIKFNANQRTSNTSNKPNSATVRELSTTFDYDEDAFMVFPDPQSRTSALDAIKKIVIDNGGKIIQPKPWKHVER
jgi:hypothetical protein